MDEDLSVPLRKKKKKVSRIMHVKQKLKGARVNIDQHVIRNVDHYFVSSDETLTLQSRTVQKESHLKDPLKNKVLTGKITTESQD